MAVFDTPKKETIDNENIQLIKSSHPQNSFLSLLIVLGGKTRNAFLKYCATRAPLLLLRS